MYFANTPLGEMWCCINRILFTSLWPTNEQIPKSYTEFGASMKNYNGDYVTLTSDVYITKRFTKPIPMRNDLNDVQSNEMTMYWEAYAISLWIIFNLHRRSNTHWEENGTRWRRNTMETEHDEDETRQRWNTMTNRTRWRWNTMTQDGTRWQTEHDEDGTRGQRQTWTPRAAESSRKTAYRWKT